MSIVFRTTLNPFHRKSIRGNPMFLATTSIISLLCLLFSTTRLMGVVALTLISYQYPLLLFVLLALTGIYLYINHSN